MCFSCAAKGVVGIEFSKNSVGIVHGEGFIMQKLKATVYLYIPAEH
jgi:uncharacterized protein (AIM24 family)